MIQKKILGSLSQERDFAPHITLKPWSDKIAPKYSTFPEKFDPLKLRKWTCPKMWPLEVEMRMFLFGCGGVVAIVICCSCLVGEYDGVVGRFAVCGICKWV